MSDSAFVVVRLDPLDAAGCERVAGEVTAWLLGTGVVAPLAESLWPHGDRLLGDFGPGLRWTDAVGLPLPEAWLDSPGEEVEVNLARSMYSALENSEDFTCVRCGTALPDGESLGDSIAEWIAGTEPVVACAQCGHAELLGDWPSAGPPGVVGAPVIEFRRWPPMRPEFVAELSRRLGRRCRSFHSFS